MNETKRNEIKKVCESLTQKEAIELCEKLMIENEKLVEINAYYGWLSEELAEYCAKIVDNAFALEIKMHDAFDEEVVNRIWE